MSGPDLDRDESQGLPTAPGSGDGTAARLDGGAISPACESPVQLHSVPGSDGIAPEPPNWTDSTLSLPVPDATPQPPVTAGELPLDRIPGYRVAREIGRGGMGVVYLAWDEQLGRNVAIKLLLNAVCGPDDPGFERFIEGARAAAAVRHPGLVTLYHAGLVDGVPYLVMEYIDGPSLAQVLKYGGALPQAAALAAMDTICNAVGELHRNDIVHGDIKPANVLVDMDGRLFVSDFGLACRQKASGVQKGEPRPVGTPAYMAPEAFQGSLTIRSDVYSLGITLYELLAGSLPFAGPLATVREQHTTVDLPLASLSTRQVWPEVSEVIERAAHKNHLFRHKSAEHLRRAIDDIAGGAEALARGASQLRHVAVRCRLGASDPQGSSGPNVTPGSYFDTLGRMASAKRSGQTPGDALTGAPPVEVEVVPPPERVVAFDLPCAQCRYNLRGLPEGRPCPTCGHSQAASLDADRLLFADRAWLERIRWGAEWLHRMMILTVVGLIGVGSVLLWRKASIDPIPTWMNFVDVVIFSVLGLLLYGALNELESEPDRPVRPLRSLGLTGARLAAIVFLPVLLMQMVAAATGRYDRLSEISMLVAFAVFWIVASPAYLLALAGLARRIPDPGLFRRTRTTAGALLLLSVACTGLEALGTWYVLPVGLEVLRDLVPILQILVLWRTVRVYSRTLRGVMSGCVSRNALFQPGQPPAAQRP